MRKHPVSPRELSPALPSGMAGIVRRTPPGGLHDARRARRWPQGVARMLRTLRNLLRRAVARRKRRELARATFDALAHLDRRTLHDLGFDRSEIASVAAEVAGEAETTRARLAAGQHRS